MSPARPLRITPIPYTGFPSFMEWATSTPNIESWEEARVSLGELECFSDVLQLVRVIIKDAASTHRNKTSTSDKENAALPLFKAMCEKVIFERGLNATLRLESQLLAYEHMMDLALNNRPISEQWIRKLHLLVINAHVKHAPLKSEGAIEHSFRGGKYKESSNHMVRKKGMNLSGAPAERTSSEMRKFCRELRGKTFLSAHPVLQASYAHYVLVLIHPFDDGNGRVARSLAFTFIYRSTLIPMLFLNKDRGQYVLALRAADAGNFQSFIDLVQERAVEAMGQIKQGVLSAIQQA